MKEGRHYVVACRSQWFWDLWERRPEPTGIWHQVRASEELTADALAEWDPRYVFFPHWSDRVPEEIWQMHECVVFHAAPVPYGRGGSPVQNLVLAGHESTEVAALRMEHDFDAGPVYLRRPVSLLGGGDEVFLRLFKAIDAMVREVAETEPDPTPQAGEPFVFRRRKPSESRLSKSDDLSSLFDQIRILDAEGYPRAFLDYGPVRIELSRPKLRRDGIQVDAYIRVRDSH